MVSSISNICGNKFSWIGTDCIDNYNAYGKTMFMTMFMIITKTMFMIITMFMSPMVQQIIKAAMQEDDETTATQLQAKLADHGIYVSLATIL